MYRNDFKGLKAIITGGASGIGEATALMLQHRGAEVFVFDKQEPKQINNNIHYIKCDITITEEIQQGVSLICNEGLDILINCAGIITFGNVFEGNEYDWFRIFDTNVFSIARVSKEIIPYLKKSNHPAIVNVSSVAAVEGSKELLIYSASKGAVNAMTLSMAADHAKDRIRVNCVAPAVTDTPLLENVLALSDTPEEDRKYIIKNQPLNRIISATDVAHAICYLASPFSISTTGTILNVDGGTTRIKI